MPFIRASVKGKRDCRAVRARKLRLLRARVPFAPREIELVDAAQFVTRVDEAAAERGTVWHHVLDNKVGRVSFAEEDQAGPVRRVRPAGGPEERGPVLRLHLRSKGRGNVGRRV